MKLFLLEELGRSSLPMASVVLTRSAPAPGTLSLQGATCMAICRLPRPETKTLNNLPPGYYLALYHGNGTAAYTSGSSPMTVTAAGAYTNAAGSEGPITPEFAINQSTTDFVEVFLFRVATQTDDPSQGLFILQSGVAADTPDIDVWFLRLWDPSGAMARKSLKDFEKDVEAMKKQIAALFSALSVQPKLSTEQLAQAAASHLGAALALSGSAKAKAGAKPLLLQPSK
jgi:hypothetical protein